MSSKVTEIYDNYKRNSYFPRQSRVHKLYSTSLFKHAEEGHDTTNTHTIRIIQQIRKRLHVILSMAKKNIQLYIQ